jgi:hypothetical protein
LTSTPGFFPSSSYHEGEAQVTRGCQTYGEAASIVPINQNVSQLFEPFFKGFPNPLWLPYLDNDNLTLPCEFSFESGRQDGRFLEILNIIIHPCLVILKAVLQYRRLRTSSLPDNPFHTVGRLMSPTYPIMHLAHHSFCFFWTQASQQYPI